MNAIISPDYYYVLTVAGQSNAMAYGEGLPLPDREDAPHPRIKQLARFAHTHPGGPSCHFNDIIPLTGNDSNLLIVFYVQIMPDDFVMQLHRF